MKIFLALMGHLVFLVSSSVVAKAQGWNGIEPLHSSRADVERILGNPSDHTAQTSVFYNRREAAVVIDYTSESGCLKGQGWQVPKGTVLEIIISPKTTVTLSELHLDERNYKRTDNPNRPATATYVNEQNGQRIDVFEGQVTSIRYFPAAKDINLRCSGESTFSEEQTSTHDYHWLDRYGRIAFAAEKRRLDNFAIHIQKNPDAVGYLIVYAGRRASVNEAEAWAKRAKAYLLKVRSVPSSRIVTIDGGYREKLTVELYLIPRDSAPPIPLPTVDRRDVKIIGRQRLRR